MRAKKKGERALAPKPTPYPRSLMKILAEVKARLYGQSEAKRGEPGTRLQASPDPHRPHSPIEIQGVCW